jgi:membrane associated rhomboid family serine protease
MQVIRSARNDRGLRYIKRMRTPDSWHTARATVAIALATVAASIIVSVFRMQDAAVAFGAFIPADVAMDLPFARAPLLLTPLTATLLHAGLFHIFFNLLILLFCGRAVEGALGAQNLVFLYVIGAYAAAVGHWAVGPTDLSPMVGASGAISAVIGAYAMLFGKNKVRVANANLALWLNALWLMAAWVGLQLVMGVALGQRGILLAIGAHIGGFLVGLALARPLLLWRYRTA